MAEQNRDLQSVLPVCAVSTLNINVCAYGGFSPLNNCAAFSMIKYNIIQTVN